MRAFWTELVRRLKTARAALAVAGAALVAALLYTLTRKSAGASGVSEHLDPVIDHSDERVAAANARAAIEIHVAETKNADVRAQLADIAKEKDARARRQRTIDLAKSIGAEKP